MILEKSENLKPRKITMGWVGIAKSYVIIRVGQQKSYTCLQGGWVGTKKARNMLT